MRKWGGIWLAGLAAGGVILLVAVVWGLDWAFFSAALPDGIMPPAVLETTRTDAGSQSSWGECYAFVRDGIRACSLSGQPYWRGQELARFYPGELKTTEQAFELQIKVLLPYAGTRWLRTCWLMLHNRHLIQHVSYEYQSELAGLAQNVKNRHPLSGRSFTRWLTYQAVHDFSRSRFWPEAPAGGLAFGVAGQATSAGRPLLAGTIDATAGGAAWGGDTLVLLVRPEQGHAFLSAGWPGLIGTAAGINDAGLAVVLLGGHCAESDKAGMPATLLARQVLNTAETLNQAVDLISTTRILSPAIFVLGSGPENSFVSVEKTPEHTEVRWLHERWLAATDLFQTPALASGFENQRYQETGIPGMRLRRLQWLLGSESGRMSVPACVGILRDQRGPQGEVIGLGHPWALASWATTHAVVFDLKKKTLWVSSPPQQHGAFVPFSLDGFAQSVSETAIPADAKWTPEFYHQYRQYYQGLRRAERLFQQRHYQEALSWLMEIRSFNPNDYRAYFLAGRALAALGRWDEARFNYSKASALHPASAQERQEVQNRLRWLEAMLGVESLR